MEEMKKWQLTSESVTEGHPDKACDQIADAILDELLRQDPYSRVACEVCATTGMILVMGEISTQKAYCDIPAVVRKTIAEIGYDKNAIGFNSETCAVITSINEQSPDIALGVDRSLESKRGGEDMLGAGDQGMMYGFACTETAELMPLPIVLSHKLTKQLAAMRKSGEAKTFCPDGKAMVTVSYEDWKPVHIDNVVVSTQHLAEADIEEVRREVSELVLKPVLPAELLDDRTEYLINPTGRFVVGGPMGDSGLTGRKIIVDTYGGCGLHGGGSFSGKDATKVDRSSAYAARYVAKNLVAAGLAERCEVAIAYAIGVAQPVSISVRTFGTGKISENEMEKIVREKFDLRPSAIIDNFGLRRPIYRQVAAYGHFGRPELELPWEKTDRAEELKNIAGIQ